MGTNNSTNKDDFFSLLKGAIQPASPKGDKIPEREKSVGYSDKKTHQDSSEDTSGKPNDMSRPKSV